MTEHAGYPFLAEARRYCAAVERASVDLREVLATLVRLVDLGLALPDYLSPSDEAVDDPVHLREDALAVGGNLRAVLGNDDLYWEVFDPCSWSEPVAGSLVDDLVDIYRDLRRGLHAAEIGRIADAVWECRVSMHTHWGVHATDAMRVLFRLIWA